MRCPYGREELATTDDVMQRNPDTILDDVTQCYVITQRGNVSLSYDVDAVTSLASVVVSVRNCERVKVTVLSENGESIQV